MTDIQKWREELHTEYEARPFETRADTAAKEKAQKRGEPPGVGSPQGRIIGYEHEVSQDAAPITAALYEHVRELIVR